jgi:methyl-accepting chemotaxis protein
MKNNQANSLDIIDQRMSSVLVEVNTFPRSAGNDILFLSKLSSLKNIINVNENHVDEIGDLKSNFLEFLKQNTAYYHLRYINEFGMEIVRADFDGENHYIILENELQDKKDRDYFQETMKLNSGEVYISKLDLNIENEEIENRRSEEDPVYVPVIRYATPVFNNNNDEKGIVISNIYADYFLEDIKRAQREGEMVFLIDNQGYYLTHPDKEKEFSFMFEDKEDNFYEDYPEIGEDLLDFNEKRFESDDFIFTFKYFYPTSTNFEVYEGSKKVFGESPEKKYYWVLISVSEKEIINKMEKNLKTNYLFSLLFYGLIILIVFILIVFIGFRRVGK